MTPERAILEKARRGLQWVAGPSDIDAREGFDPSILWVFIRPDFETGKMFWRKRPDDIFEDSPTGKVTAKTLALAWNKKHAGKEAFCKLRADGYLQGGILGHCYLAHRVMYALAVGSWPKGEVDHINGRKTDNRAENLRDVSKAQNQKNARISKANTSGATGVGQVKKNGRWYARARVNGRNGYIGFFDTFEEAAAARRAANPLLGYHPNHGRKQ